MNFSYEYTAEQQAFRAQVSDWLDRNAPADGAALFDSTNADALRELTLRLGTVGWLAPSESERNGGAALSADQTVILLEELNRRGLLRLVEDEAQALRTALAAHLQTPSPLEGWDGGELPRAARIRDLATGKLAVWKHAVSLSPPGDAPRLDTDSVGVKATSDADGYILNGTARFTGAASNPAILWTVALVQPDNAPVCLLVDATSDGVLRPPNRALAPTAPRVVEFEDVWVLKTDALGDEGDGHRVLSTRVSLDARADLPSWVERDTDALIQFAIQDGASQDPIRARMLVEAYIASRVSRLLRMSATFAERDGGALGDSDKAAALSALWRRQSGAALADAAGQVVGPRAMLSSDDPRAVDGGRYERLSRRELAERERGRRGAGRAGGGIGAMAGAAIDSAIYGRQPVFHRQARHAPEVPNIPRNHRQVPRKGYGGYPRVGVADGRSPPFQIRPQLSVAPCGVGVERQDREVRNDEPIDATEQVLRSMPLPVCAVHHLRYVYAGRESTFGRYGVDLIAQRF